MALMFVAGEGGARWGGSGPASPFRFCSPTSVRLDQNADGVRYAHCVVRPFGGVAGLTPYKPAQTSCGTKSRLGAFSALKAIDPEWRVCEGFEMACALSRHPRHWAPAMG